MLFWLGILIGLILAVVAVKKGFYETWAIMFNIIIAIYLAVFLTPAIKELIPISGRTSYSDILTIVVVAILSFAILHGIVYVLVLNQFNVNFPKILEIFGSGLLGFLGGLLIWSFVCILIFASPLSKNTFFDDIGFNNQTQQTNISYVSWWVNLVDLLVSSGDDQQSTEEAIGKMLKENETKKQRKTTPETDEPNEPDKTSGPNETKDNSADRIEPDPLPEPDELQ